MDLGWEKLNAFDHVRVSDAKGCDFDRLCVTRWMLLRTSCWRYRYLRPTHFVHFRRFKADMANIPLNKSAHPFDKTRFEALLNRRFFYAPAFEIYGGAYRHAPSASSFI
jgi:hypothetical protein